MPTYENACTQCGRRVEVVQAFSDAPLEKCEECGGRLRRVFHPVGVLFKGSGFYSTDARAGRGTGRPSTDGEKAGSKGESKSGSSSKEGGNGSSKKGDGGSNKKGEGGSNKKAGSSSGSEKS